MELNARVQRSGPIFDGRADAAASAFASDASREVSQEGVNLVVQEGWRTYQNPTGYYASQVQSERAAAGWRVWDDGVVYGPWLEGVGEQNRTTRFKGYSIYRRMTQVLAARAPEIAQRILRKYIGRMN